MAPVTFVLLHGAGGTGAYWGLVRPRLEAAGHRVLAPDLPNHPGATFADQGEAVVALVSDHASEPQSSWSPSPWARTPRRWPPTGSNRPTSCW